MNLYRHPKSLQRSAAFSVRINGNAMEVGHELSVESVRHLDELEIYARHCHGSI